VKEDYELELQEIDKEEEDKYEFSDPRKYPEILSQDRKFLQQIENYEHPNSCGNKLFWKNKRGKPMESLSRAKFDRK
jgi:hypothetical protein